MTEPKPVYYTNTTGNVVEYISTAMPSGGEIDPRVADTTIDATLTMPRVMPPTPMLEARLDNLEALVLELFKRLQKLEAFP